ETDKLRSPASMSTGTERKAGMCGIGEESKVCFLVNVGRDGHGLEEEIRGGRGVLWMMIQVECCMSRQSTICGKGGRVSERGADVAVGCAFQFGASHLVLFLLSVLDL